MLENQSIDSSASSVKRYAPPNQRNRSLGRRKSGGEGLERANSYSNDGEKNQMFAGKIAPPLNQGDIGRSRKNEISPGQLIPLHGCCDSEAFQLLNDRWAAAMHAYNISPEDSSERPVLYSRRSAASPWGQGMLPHLIMQPGGHASSGSQKDFLSELQNAIHNYHGNSGAGNLGSTRVGGGEDPQFHLNSVIR